VLKPNSKSKSYQMQIEKKMTNCPECNKPILNGGVFPSHAKFSMRCPWCQATLEINIQPRILTELIRPGSKKTEETPLAKLDESGEFTETEGLKEAPKTYRLVGHVYPESKDES